MAWAEMNTTNVNLDTGPGGGTDAFISEEDLLKVLNENTVPAAQIDYIEFVPGKVTSIAPPLTNEDTTIAIAVTTAGVRLANNHDIIGISCPPFRTVLGEANLG